MVMSGFDASEITRVATSGSIGMLVAFDCIQSANGPAGRVIRSVLVVMWWFVQLERRGRGPSPDVIGGRTGTLESGAAIGRVWPATGGLPRVATLGPGK